jgi:hypothetical protein
VFDTLQPNLPPTFACSFRCRPNWDGWDGREIGALDGKLVKQDSTGTRNIATFMTELATKLPRHMLAHITLMLPHLEQEVCCTSFLSPTTIHLHAIVVIMMTS